ncbi:MAG: hypothetical protein KDD62_01095 [Bdellovibrionales bacterium]|nr:hypothetical protein [Bdellovibrionales bacterium]
MNFALIGIIVFALIIFSIFVLFPKMYVRCPSNMILVKQGGLIGGNRAMACYHGGATLVVPLIQEAAFLDLTPMTINIPLKGALSFQNIRVNVPSTFTIGVSTQADTMENAAVRLLNVSLRDIEVMASEIIFGQLRLTIASLKIEEINQDRERFLEAIRNNIDPELRKIGLYLINVNITDITDESGYIESIGKKAASTAINQAKVDVAEEEKKGDIGSAEADKERRIRVAELNAAAVEGENQSKARVADFNATLAEKEAEAARKGEVANQRAIAAVQEERAVAEAKRLHAEEVVSRQIEKQKVEIDAAALAEKKRREAVGQADAILAIKSAEAQGIEKVLDAKARGYQGIVHAASTPKEAATLLMVEKVQDLVKFQAEAISNLKIDKITVWDSANGEKGSSTANFMSSLIKSLPALHDVAEMAGVSLPEYLGELEHKPKKNGYSNGKSQPSEQTEGEA